MGGKKQQKQGSESVRQSQLQQQESESAQESGSNQKKQKAKKKKQGELKDKKQEQKKARQKNKPKDSDSDEESIEGKPKKQRNSDGQIFWQIGKNKRVTISQFKNKLYVNIREYYEKDGQFLPSKKGISLPKQQWETLKKIVQEVDKDLIQTEASKGKKKVKR